MVRFDPSDVFFSADNYTNVGFPDSEQPIKLVPKQENKDNNLGSAEQKRNDSMKTQIQRRLACAVVLAAATQFAQLHLGAQAIGPGQTPASPQVSGTPEYVPGQYIVTLQPGVSPEDVLRFHQLRPKHVYQHALNGFAGAIPDGALDRLVNDPRVLRIELDQVGHLSEVESTAPWGLDRIDQRYLPLDTAYSFNATGAGVTVYMVDTGIRYTHTEFGGRASFGFDAFGGDGSDCHGHGTHTAGTVGGALYGVAKNVNLVSVKVGGPPTNCSSGSVYASDVIAGINWVIAHHVRPAAANMSLGWSGGNVSIDGAVRNLVASGVATAVAAMNNSSDACLSSPGRVAEVMTVGAVDATDTKASFSNYGNCIDWFAPGVSITSASYLSDTGTAVMSGTSMAAPHTAGVAALYLQNHPTATPQEVQDALFSFTTKNVVLTAQSPNQHLLFSFEEPMAGYQLYPPTVDLTSPLDGALVPKNKNLTITATASDSDGVVASVKFYVNGTLKGTDTSAPYSCAFRTGPPGMTYTIYVVATDNSGITAQSPTIRVTTK